MTTDRLTRFLAVCCSAFCVLLAAHRLAAQEPPAAAPLGLTVDDDDRRDGGVAGLGLSRYFVNLSAQGLALRRAFELRQGRALVDIEVHWNGAEERFSGVWAPMGGTLHYLIQGSPTEWREYYESMGPLRGRYLDIEVGYFGGAKRYSAIFLEDGDDYGYALYTTNSDAEFQTRLREQLRRGRRIVDFEAYREPNGTIRYAGLWVSDPKQPMTHLYYGLESADVSDLLRPLAGRVIDLEYYYSPVHREHRWALITAAYRGGGWGVWRNDDADGFAARHEITADADTHLIDLEVWESSGELRHAGVWGDAYKSLHEVGPIVQNDDVEPIPDDLVTLTENFEGAAGSLGMVGFYARNVRTHQSISYRADTPFYLASATKVAIHIKLWREIEAGRLSLRDRIQYTLDENTPEPWYVDDRSGPGLTSCAFTGGNCSSDFGLRFRLESLDSAMMRVSDNAATSMLVDQPELGLSWAAEDLNEWIAGLDGVAPGWGVVTSIHDVDRTILWQSQVMARPTERSFFTIPAWRFEPWFRQNNDFWNTLAPLFGGRLPSRDFSDGTRYFNMGLNSATPRAFGRLLEAFVEGEYLDAMQERALDSMNEATVLGAHRAFPNHVTVRSKGGVKGDTVCDTSIFQIGPDAIALGVYTQDNTRNVGQVRAFTQAYGLRLLEELTSDLVGHDGSNSPGVAQVGDSVSVNLWVDNRGGGDATAFDVRFIARRVDGEPTAGIRLGARRVSRLRGGETTLVTGRFTLPPAVTPGTYEIRYIIDPPRAGEEWQLGEVGELDETNNSGWVSTRRLTVQGAPQGVPFRRGDVESDGTVAMSDAIRVFGFLFLGNEPPECMDAADANDDGRVDLSDGVAILEHLFLGTGSIPAPGPQRCGLDPTDDALSECRDPACEG